MAEVWWTDDDTRREEEWVDALRAMPGARVPLRRFGSGDCGCEGHLVRFPERPAADGLHGAVGGPARPASGIQRSTPDEIPVD